MKVKFMFVWQVIWWVPAQAVRILFCLSVFIFKLDVKLMKEAWRETS